VTELDPRLDWRNLNPDPRDLPLSAVRPLEDVVPRSKLWVGPRERVDQGREGACVGFGWTVEALSSPVRVKIPGAHGIDVDAANGFALGVYRAAQKIDPWPGEDYSGTSVRAGAKIMRDLGYFAEFRTCGDAGEVRAAVCTPKADGGGPVVLGVPWFQSMYGTDDRGMVRVDGRLVGGHCITVTGYVKRHAGREVLRWRNSWGPGYGLNGDGFITLTDLDRLLAGDDRTGTGEAWVPIGRQTPTRAALAACCHGPRPVIR
jgi:hypothetical protein